MNFSLLILGHDEKSIFNLMRIKKPSVNDSVSYDAESSRLTLEFRSISGSLLHHVPFDLLPSCMDPVTHSTSWCWRSFPNVFHHFDSHRKSAHEKSSTKFSFSHENFIAIKRKLRKMFFHVCWKLLDARDSAAWKALRSVPEGNLNNNLIAAINDISFPSFFAWMLIEDDEDTWRLFMSQFAFTSSFHDKFSMRFKDFLVSFDDKSFVKFPPSI